MSGPLLAGRRILVVGAGTRPWPGPDTVVGNGRAIAITAARGGARVACADVDTASAAQTARLVSDAGGTAVVIGADVTDPHQCRGCVEQAHRDLDGLDGLVLNVGIGEGTGIAGTSPDQWDKVFATNVRSHFLLVQAALPLLQPGGAIVFVSSVAALKPGTGVPAYDASKAALLGLCRHVALEAAPHHIRVNAVAPGLIDTPMGRQASVRRPDRQRTRVPLGRHGTAWEVAAAVVFLLSEQASYITGQVLAVDGGLSTLR